MKREQKDLFIEAKEEIKQLRQTNKVMGARLQMFDDVMSLFNAEPRRHDCGMAEDLVWKIEKAIEADKVEKDAPTGGIQTARRMDGE